MPARGIFSRGVRAVPGGRAVLKYNIVPKPNRYTKEPGSYTVSSGTQVLCAKEFWMPAII